MIRGRYLKYGFKFQGGKEKLYILTGYQFGFLHFRVSSIILDLEEAERVMELLQKTDKPEVGFSG